VDALEIGRVAGAGLERATSEQLSELRQLFSGDLLEGTPLDEGPEFLAWLSAASALSIHARHPTRRAIGARPT